MLIGFHVILSYYGFWLPNDPRGSWSDTVKSYELFRYGGGSTKHLITQPGVSVAHKPHDFQQRFEVKKHLQYPPVVLNNEQIQAVAEGFGIAAEKYPVYACAILPEHVHLVFGRLELDVRKTAAAFKAKATMQLYEKGLHPEQLFTPHPFSPSASRTGSASRTAQTKKYPLWAEHGWFVYIDNERQLRTAIRYVENNPVKEGRPPQQWDFIKPHGIASADERRG